MFGYNSDTTVAEQLHELWLQLDNLTETTALSGIANASDATPAQRKTALGRLLEKARVG